MRPHPVGLDVVYRPIKDDATVVVQQRRRGIDGKESAVKVGVDHLLENGLVGRAGGRPAGDAGVGKHHVEFPEIFGQGCEELFAVFRNSDVCTVATHVWSEFCYRFVERLLVATGNGDLCAFSNEQSGGGQTDATVTAGDKGLFPVSFLMPPF
jgi:hypothetical protein